MADARISQLPSASTISANDVLPFTSISASETRRITANSLGLVLTQLGLTVGSSAPTSPAPYNGQLWVDTSTNPPVLKVYNGASFTIVSFLPGSSVATSPSNSAPTSPVAGQLWFDTSQNPDELKIYDGANFVRVDPQGITQTAGDARYLQLDSASGSPTSAASYLQLAGGALTGNLTLVGDPSSNNMASNKKYVDDSIAAIPAATDLTPAGTIIYSARSTPPTGYLAANGAEISRSTFDTLFAAIGTTYGNGNGSTTFNVPDLRGEFIRGLDSGRGVDSGRGLGSQQASANVSHTHEVEGSTDTTQIRGTVRKISETYAGLGTASGVFSKMSNQDAGLTPDSPDTSPTGGFSLVADHSHPIDFTSGSRGGTESRPRNIALLACIKT